MTPLGTPDLIVTIILVVVAFVIVAGVLRWAVRQLTGR